MNTVIIVVIAIVVVGGMIMLSVAGGRRKKDAIADLQRERDSLHTPGILDLVNEELREAGVSDLPGADGISPVILLKVWKRDREDCAEQTGGFIVADGVNPSEATEADVVFDCDGK